MGNLETGFSSNSVSFFSLPSSKIFEHEPTVSEALELSGMNFEVGKRPVFQQLNNKAFSEVPGQFASYRLDNETALGVVGNQWAPFNNEPAFALVDELLGHGARIAAAGTWNEGADVFITAHLPEGIRVAGEENLDLYLLFRNNHAGKGSVSSYITPVRISCTNMERFAIREAVSSWKARHTHTVGERVQEVSATLRLVDSYKESMETSIRQLQDTHLEMEEIDNFLKEWTQAERVQNSVRETYLNSDHVSRGNAWGLINSITESLQHNPSRRTGPETRFASNLDGPNQRSVERACRMLLTR